MNNLYDTLEICLEQIENGAEIESVLQNYPDLADELRPILQASLGAKKLSAPAPSMDVIRKNRARILQRAAEMRESKVTPVVRMNWLVPLRRLVSTLAIVLLVFASGTSLVGAASTSLPGESLYPVKRSWENLQLLFTFNAKFREALEVEHENERIEELRELLADGRSASVTFSGLATRQTDTGWLVAGVPVVISPQTDLPAQGVLVNSAVRVVGTTQSDGSVLATSIELLPPGSSLPEAEDEPGREDDSQNEVESTPESGEDAPESVATQTPEAEEIEFDGTLDILNEDFWTINGVPSDVSTAEVIGTPTVGAAVTVEGFFDESGVFIVTKIKFEEDNSNSGGSNSNDDNSGDNDANDNDNSNGNSNDNSNDNNDDDENNNDDD
ncbi:MAG: DUF5667 domain-containing protein [Chloroflexota bacterium]